MDGSFSSEHGFCESDSRSHQCEEREGLLYVDVTGARSLLELVNTVVYLGGSEAWRMDFPFP